MNTCCFTGNISSKLELKTASKNGLAIIKFSVAVQSTTPSDKLITSYLCFTAFGTTAQNISKYCRKGSKVGITSHANLNHWQDSHGIYHNDTQFIVETIDFLQSSKDVEVEQDDEEDAVIPEPQPKTEKVEEVDVVDEDDMPW